MDKTKKKAIYGLIGSVVLLLIIIGTSYAYIKYDTEEKDINVIGTDCIKLEMEDISEGITLQKAYPMTNANGEATNPYKFRLTNECSVGVNYQIELRVEEVEEDKKMPVENNIATKIDDKTKVVLSEDNKVPKTETQTDEKYTIGNGTLEPYGEKTHEVRIWLDEGAGNETQNKIFKSKVVVEALQNQIAENNYKEAILHGADPVLESTKTSGPVAMLTANEIAEEPTTTDKLIPVKIEATKEGTGTTVTVADLTEEWYNYEKHEWANAVILKDDNNVETLEPGTELQEDEIESYFVWIPKYSYKLFDDKLGEYESRTEKEDKSNQAIEIRFGTENTTDNGNECKTPMLANGVQGASGESGSCEKGKRMTHPAFLAFGDVKGLWVGKFETGYEGAESTSAAQQGTADSTKIVIKPNQYSWRAINVSNAFETAKAYQRNLDSHMMKNTEWGAVAYLTQSIYGRCKKIGEQTTCEEVMINNNQNEITGYAAKTAPESEEDNSEAVTPKNDGNNSVNYNNHDSVKACTTGNYTGIYDMSGGAYEYVMGVMYASDDKTPSYGSSGFTEETFPKDSKYYDKYKYGTNYADYTRRILGDATGETQKWYTHEGHFAQVTEPWFHRGGYYSYGTNTGVFHFDDSVGDANYNYNGFRIVLAPLS